MPNFISLKSMELYILDSRLTESLQEFALAPVERGGRHGGSVAPVSP